MLVDFTEELIARFVGWALYPPRAPQRPGSSSAASRPLQTSRAQRRVSIVGGPGAGKSSFVANLLKDYDPGNGDYQFPVQCREAVVGLDEIQFPDLARGLGTADAVVLIIDSETPGPAAQLIKRLAQLNKPTFLLCNKMDLRPDLESARDVEDRLGVSVPARWLFFQASCIDFRNFELRNVFHQLCLQAFQTRQTGLKLQPLALSESIFAPAKRVTPE